MSRQSIDDFAHSYIGCEFFATYDALLARWPYGARSIDVHTPHGRTRANVCGPDDGAAVVLLPGSGATSTAYTRTATSLAGAGYRVIALGVSLSDHRSRFHRTVLLDPSGCFGRMRTGYLMHALPMLLGRSPQRQRRLLEWEVGTTDLVAAGLDREWLTVVCAGAAFPAARPVIPRRPKPTDLATLDGTSLSVILAPDSKIHDSRAIARHVTETIPQAAVSFTTTGTHHTFPLAPDELSDALLAALA